MRSILDTVGNTPLVELTRLNPNPAVTIFAKLEGNNPGGSVKDRPALNMIRSALERGEITPQTKLIEAIVAGDPAAHSAFEVVRAYPGFYALCFYRIAHELHQLKIPMLPRILTEMAHSRTGIDIHPAATIGEYFCIDHGTGIVIGGNVWLTESVQPGSLVSHQPEITVVEGKFLSTTL